MYSDVNTVVIISLFAGRICSNYPIDPYSTDFFAAHTNLQHTVSVGVVIISLFAGRICSHYPIDPYSEDFFAVHINLQNTVSVGVFRSKYSGHHQFLC